MPRVQIRYSNEAKGQAKKKSSQTIDGTPRVCIFESLIAHVVAPVANAIAVSAYAEPLFGKTTWMKPQNPAKPNSV